MVTPCQKKRVTHFYLLYRSTLKKRARLGSVLRATCILHKKELLSTQLYEIVLRGKPADYKKFQQLSGKKSEGNDMDKSAKSGFPL